MITKTVTFNSLNAVEIKLLYSNCIISELPLHSYFVDIQEEKVSENIKLLLCDDDVIKQNKTQVFLHIVDGNMTFEKRFYLFF